VSEGQIFIPEINTALMVACVWLVLSFKQSSALAAAYGIAVTGTMAITSVIYFWCSPTPGIGRAGKRRPLVGLFLVFDWLSSGRTCSSFPTGGGSPWARHGDLPRHDDLEEGARPSRSQPRRQAPASQHVPRGPSQHQPSARAGTAVFMSSNPNGVPVVLLHHWKHNQVLHQTVVLLSVISETLPEIPSSRRVLAIGTFRPRRA